MTVTTSSQAAVDAVRSVAGRAARIGLHEPEFAGNEWQYVKECIDTGWVSSVGPFVDRFEKELAQYTGARHAVAIVNGTAALHLCLRLAGVEHGDEVLVPSLTFIATANAVSYCGATPHFCDVEEATLGIDAGKLDRHLRDVARMSNGECFNRITGARIKAVVPMHTFGHPTDMDELLAVADRHGIVVVEDAAESLGSLYKGRHTGTLARLGALSFNGNKIATTGGGGAILTNDDGLAKAAKHLSTTARVPHKWSFLHDEVGYNYRMPNINAALGVAQLERLDQFVSRKRALADAYQRAFRSVDDVRVFIEPPHARSNYWLNAIVVADRSGRQRDEMLEALNADGLMARPAWTLMHRLPIYAGRPSMDLSTSEDMERRLVNLPSSAGLSAP